MGLINKADFVILTSVPFGTGNLKNLDAANFAIGQGIPTFVLNESPIETRDFTKGEAEKKMLSLKNKGATYFEDEHTLLTALSDLAIKQVAKKIPSDEQTTPVLQTAKEVKR